jgi:hypothetical protein
MGQRSEHLDSESRRRRDHIRARLTQLWSEPLARGLAAGLVLVPLLLLLVLALLPSSHEPFPRALHDPITVTRSLSPATALFGDRLEAEIDVYTNDERIDPASVHVQTDFRPYEAVATTIDRSSQGTVSLLRTTISLSCLTPACLPSRSGGRVFRFRPLTVSYRQGARPRTLQQAWDRVRVYSRLGPNPRLVDTPPRLDSGFRVSPGVAQVVLALLAAGLALIGAVWVVTGFWPRFPYSLRRWRRLSPLEQALAQLDAAARIDDEDVRRRVLDQLATRLGEHDLALLERRSRSLAWGEAVPAPEELDRLGEHVRTSLNGGPRS